MSDVDITLKGYIETYMKIQTKNGELIPLKMNYAQNRLYDLFADAYERDEPFKCIILKARQMGLSTCTEAIMTALCMTNHFRNGLIVAHTSDSSTHIYNMAKRYYENLPKGLKPMMKYSNAKELRFENPAKDPPEELKGLRSSIRVATAGQGGVGRSQTFNYMHLSELAFWEEQDGQTVADQMTGLLQTLPQHGFSMLVIESTANGYNYFKNLWDQAASGESDFIPLFIPWYEMEDYRLPYHGEDLTEDELELKKKFFIDNEQIMWRRYAIRNLCGNDLDKFRQEYPSTPEEAFIMSGSPVFDLQRVLKRLEEVPNPIAQGTFSEMGNFYEDSKGYTKIWEHPIPGHAYCLGADTAGEGSDYFVVHVADKSQMGKQVAQYRAETDEQMFVKQLYFLGHYYNYGLIAPETNFSSYVTMKLQEMGYYNMYVREAVDTYTSRTQKKFGFRTTSLTRPLIIDMLKEVVAEHIDILMSKELLKEMLSFVKNEKNGKPEAASGAHDDCIMAAAITYFAIPQAQTGVYFDDDSDTSIMSSDELSFINYGA